MNINSIVCVMYYRLFIFLMMSSGNQTIDNTQRRQKSLLLYVLKFIAMKRTSKEECKNV